MPPKFASGGGLSATGSDPGKGAGFLPLNLRAVAVCWRSWQRSRRGRGIPASQIRERSRPIGGAGSEPGQGGGLLPLKFASGGGLSTATGSEPGLGAGFLPLKFASGLLAAIGSEPGLSAGFLPLSLPSGGVCRRLGTGLLPLDFRSVAAVGSNRQQTHARDFCLRSGLPRVASSRSSVISQRLIGVCLGRRALRRRRDRRDHRRGWLRSDRVSRRASPV